MLVVWKSPDVRYLAGYEEGRIVGDTRHSHEELGVLVRFNSPSDLLIQLVYLPVPELDGLQVIVHRVYGERPEVGLAVFGERVSLILQPSRRELRMDLVLLHGPELDHVVPPPHQVLISLMSLPGTYDSGIMSALSRSASTLASTLSVFTFAYAI